ncbi:anti-sigma factor domain-containing protein [Salinisphaera sp. Q1T1-3]|uniref:anti-sigma factor n=1 Tax=Salinisphaera sp. Q1T1-3 TaxID=2321229 RepID=UPI000E7720CC|nr:anti-sigma factor [Salinisphaera sp. Q1T1-3]RJS94281.1 hypothetical protein D3260_04000 [Salinisphaera sp. Q1T1-3]
MTAPRDDELNLTAAEYVLGTLESEAARAFQQRLVDDAGARACLSAWEARLARLGEDLAPVRPPGAVWDRVARRTGIEARPAQADARPSEPSRRAPRPRRRWRGVAFGASAVAAVLALILAVGLFQPMQTHTSGNPAMASVIYDQPTGTSWLVTTPDPNGKTLSVEAMSDYRVPHGKALKLWVKSGDAAPLLVGTLPHTAGDYAMPLSSDARRAMSDGGKLVVSMENADARQSQPQGPIMWVSPIARRTG